MARRKGPRAVSASERVVRTKSPLEVLGSLLSPASGLAQVRLPDRASDQRRGQRDHALGQRELPPDGGPEEGDDEQHRRLQRELVQQVRRRGKDREAAISTCGRPDARERDPPECVCVPLPGATRQPARPCQARGQRADEEAGRTGAQQTQADLPAGLDKALGETVGSDLRVCPRSYGPRDHGGYGPTDELSEREEQDVRRQGRRADQYQEAAAGQPDDQHRADGRGGGREQGHGQHVRGCVVRLGQGDREVVGEARDGDQDVQQCERGCEDPEIGW